MEGEPRSETFMGRLGKWAGWKKDYPDTEAVNKELEKFESLAGDEKEEEESKRDVA